MYTSDANSSGAILDLSLYLNQQVLDYNGGRTLDDMIEYVEKVVSGEEVEEVKYDDEDTDDEYTDGEDTDDEDTDGEDTDGEDTDEPAEEIKKDEL